MTMFKRRAALYVGDDRTDEDVFSLGLPRVMGVRVGQRRGSSARFFMREQREIDRLLTMILDAVERLGQ